MDDSIKLPQVFELPAHHQHFSRAMLLRNPRCCSRAARKYFRRNSANHDNASTSHGKVTPSLDENIFFNFSNEYHSDDSGQHTDWDSVSHDVGKMVCEICERLLRKKPHMSGGIGSSNELSVVAVLVCGHVYHADCLEQKTCQEAQTDPSCPMCSSLIPNVDASIREE